MPGSFRPSVPSVPGLEVIPVPQVRSMADIMFPTVDCVVGHPLSSRRRNLSSAFHTLCCEAYCVSLLQRPLCLRNWSFVVSLDA